MNCFSNQLSFRLKNPGSINIPKNKLGTTLHIEAKGANSSTGPHSTLVGGILKNEQEGVDGGNLNNVLCREYYCYKLQV